MRKPVVYGFIFARGGSKGVPGKNIRDLGGKPLIAHSIDLALAHPMIDRVIVSTDSQEIAAVAQEYGAEVPFLRPAELASDTAPERMAWRHAISELEKSGDGDFDLFVSLPATCPLRAPEDVSGAIELFLEGGADTVVTATEPQAHPSFNMIKMNGEGYASIAMPVSGVTRRQDAPPIYELTAVCYVTRPAFVFETDSYFDGRVKAYLLPPERAADIDTELDFAFVEFLFNRLNKK